MPLDGEERQRRRGGEAFVPAGKRIAHRRLDDRGTHDAHAHAVLLRARHHLRSEEHTSELQSPCNLVCRLLLEKKNKTPIRTHTFFSLSLPPPGVIPLRIPDPRVLLTSAGLSPRFACCWSSAGSLGASLIPLRH